MSGPKAGSFQVDPAVLAEQRRLRSAVDRHAQLSRHRQAVATRLAGRRRRKAAPIDVDLGPALHSVDDLSTEEIEDWNTRAADLLSRADEALRAAEHTERSVELARQLAAIAGDDVAARLQARAKAERQRDAAGDVNEERGHTPAGHPPSPRADVLVGEVTRTISRLHPDAAEAEREEIEKLARAVVEGKADRSASLLVELQVRVQRINGAARARAEDAARARSMVDELNGLSGAAVEWARALLASVIEGTAALLGSDVDRIRRIAVAAEAEAARSYAVDQLVKAFESAGYPVQQGFATVVLGGRNGYAALPGSDDHAVEIDVHNQQVAVRVVRAHGNPAAQADAQAERQFCRGFSDISADMYAQGVSLRVTRHEAPGAVPMEHVGAAQAALATVEREATTSELKVRKVQR